GITTSLAPQQAGGFADYAGTRRAHGMTERYGSAIDIERLIANAQLLNTGECLARKRLVELDHIDVGDTEFRLLQSLMSCRDRTDPHQPGCAASDRSASNARK